MVQLLPTYRHLFEKDNRWCKQETEHFVFCYFKGSEAHKDIDSIKNIQETGFSNIIKTLKIRVPDKKIFYYFYPNKKIKKNLMGDDWYAQAVISEFCVHVLYTKKIKPTGPHEDVHLLTSGWGDSVGFFEEGLAEYFVGYAWDNRPHVFYVNEGVRKKYYLPIRRFFLHQTWLDTDDNLAIYFYSLAASFSKFLIENYGLDKYIKVYKKLKRQNTELKNLNIFRKNYSLDIDKMEKSFYLWISEAK